MKYLLDTDVISQYKKLAPDSRVDAWLEGTDQSDLYISSITMAELWYGVYLMAASKRRSALQAWLEEEVPAQFSDRILPFGPECAATYGRLLARAQKRGHNAGVLDTMIAAIAVAHGMTVATLNRKDFERLGVEVVEFG